MRIAVVSDNEERFQPGNRVFLRSDTQSREYTIESFEWHNGRNAFISLDGINDRTAAEAVAGSALYITKDDAEQSRDILGEDEFYFYDLAGADAYLNGVLFGTVDDLIEGGSGVLLSIKDGSGKEFLIPFVGEMVGTERLLAERRIDLMPVEGLFDI
jgi:16S rRNA processing protein RimM